MSDIKKFVNTFDIGNPDWDILPEGFPDNDLNGLISTEVGKYNAIISLSEIQKASTLQPKSRSRVWKNPEGYRYLVQWSNTVLLRHFVREFTSALPKSEYRRKVQIDDAARSVVRNIEEGYKRATTKEYLDFLGYSQGSLEEVKGDIRELTEDDFLSSRHGSTLEGIGINLGDFNKALKEDKGKYRTIQDNTDTGDKGKYRTIQDNTGNNLASKFHYHPLTILYPPLKNVSADDLSYEVFFWTLLTKPTGCSEKLSNRWK